MNDNIDFDALEEQTKIQLKKKDEQEKAAEEAEANKKLTDGWTARPFIIGGVIALLLILFAVYVVFIM